MGSPLSRGPGEEPASLATIWPTAGTALPRRGGGVPHHLLPALGQLWPEPQVRTSEPRLPLALGVTGSNRVQGPPVPSQLILLSCPICPPLCPICPSLAPCIFFCYLLLLGLGCEGHPRGRQSHQSYLKDSSRKLGASHVNMCFYLKIKSRGQSNHST